MNSRAAAPGSPLTGGPFLHPPTPPYHRVKSKSLIHQDTYSGFYTHGLDTLRTHPPNSPRSPSTLAVPGIPKGKPVNSPQSPMPQGQS